MRFKNHFLESFEKIDSTFETLFEASGELGLCIYGKDGKTKDNTTSEQCTALDPVIHVWQQYTSDFPAPQTPSSNTNYTFLAPLPCDPADNTLKGVVCDSEKKTLTSFDPTGDSKLGTYLNIMIKIFIGICAILAVIMIIMGGLEYMTSELAETKTHGKHRIGNALFGLVLAVGAWTILYTINPKLLDTDLTSLGKVEVVVNIDDSSPQTPDPNTGKYGNTGYKKGDVWDGTPTALPEGVSVNTGECARVGDSGCTSLKGLNMSAVLDIKSRCPSCSLTISGGTEFWLHGGQSGRTSHGKGSSTVDLKTNPTLNAFLSGGKPLVKYQRYPSDGGPYYYEGNHWHVGP
jgi:hypothetical protein